MVYQHRFVNNALFHQIVDLQTFLAEILGNFKLFFVLTEIKKLYNIIVKH